MLQFKLKNDDKKWNLFVNEQMDNQLITIAHNPSLAAILGKSFNVKAKKIIIEKNNLIIGIFPIVSIKNKVISIPHFSYGDILFAGNLKEKQKLRNKIIGKKYEIRSFESFSKYFDDSKIMSYLELKNSEEEQWKYWKSKLRSQIRKGVKNGVTIKIGHAEYLYDFYKIYSRNMHDLGSPVLSYRFFKNIMNLYDYGEAKIFLAQKGEKYIAASLILTYHNFAEVCWASSLRKYNSTNANMVLYWEMIKYCVQHKYKYFSFGRSTKNSNIHKFKKQWSPEEKQLYFNYSSEPKINIKKLSFLANIWRNLPLFITNRIGPFFAKRIY